MRCDVRVWKRIRKRLIERGKLYVYTNYLRNERADREVEACLNRIKAAAEAGLASAAKREENRKIINGSSVGRPVQQPTPTSTNLSSLLPSAANPGGTAMRKIAAA